MSRNDKIRKLSRILPDIPMIDSTGGLVSDLKGGVVYINHFRQIKAIYARYKGDSDKINEMCGRYIVMCYKMDKLLKSRQKEYLRRQYVYMVAINLFVIYLNMILVYWLLTRL